MLFFMIFRMIPDSIDQVGGYVLVPEKGIAVDGMNWFSFAEDYEAMFSGNIDDHFRIGISISKKCLKLYSKFYGADIIVSSPLGLRTIIGAEG